MFPLIARLFNSRYFIQIETMRVLPVICGLQVLAWGIFIYAYYVTKEEVDDVSIYWAFATCTVQVFAFSLTESIILGLMKDIPQELTIPFNIGKATGKGATLMFTVIFVYGGLDSVKYCWLVSLLIWPSYAFALWFIDNINSHAAHINYYKGMETAETVESPETQAKQSLKHIKFLRHATVNMKNDMESRIQMHSQEEDAIAKVYD